MRREFIALLKELNRKFYNDFAGAFSASRSASEPGLERILQQVHSGDRVLDLGCGQGRLAFLLSKDCTYVGMDFSVEMLAMAQQQADAANVEARFVVGDLLATEWPVIGEMYDWIILRAVLHHIPGLENRQAILCNARRLLTPNGKIVMANWQFLEIERLRRRVLDWATLDLSATDVEPGDYLLDWQRDGYGLRYVHLVDEAETRALAQAANLHITSLFRADGRQNNLTLYTVLSRSN